MTGTVLPDLQLNAASLFSKWGFHDGTLLLDWMYDAEDETGQDFLTLRRAVDYQTALQAVVIDHLLPHIPGDYTTYTLGTSHNPIRIGTWRGVEWDDHADNAPAEVEDLTVTVPGDVVLAAWRSAATHPGVTS